MKIHLENQIEKFLLDEFLTHWSLEKMEVILIKFQVVFLCVK